MLPNHNTLLELVTKNVYFKSLKIQIELNLLLKTFFFFFWFLEGGVILILPLKPHQRDKTIFVFR